MKKQIVIFISLWAIINFLIACNKNSNELPPLDPLPKQDTVFTPLILNGSEALHVSFVQKKENGRYTVTAYLSNVTGQDISNLGLLFEVYKGTRNYDSTSLQSYFGPLTVRTIADTNIVLYRNGLIDIKDSVSSTIDIHVVNYKNTVQPYAGIYDCSCGYANFFNDTNARITNYSTYAKGYVQADGTARFYLKSASGDFFNINANLNIPNLPDPGTISIPGGQILPFTLDSVNSGTDKVIIDTSNDNLHMRLKLKSLLPDSVNTIELYLKKN